MRYFISVILLVSFFAAATVLSGGNSFDDPAPTNSKELASNH